MAKAVAKVTDDADSLLTFSAYPAERWRHLRTTNPIERTFALSAPYQGQQGSGQRRGRAGDGLQAAAGRRTALPQGQRSKARRAGPRGARFERGKLIERPERKVNSEATDGQVAA